MSARPKIIKALTDKGYINARAEFTPISYYSTGREGGWDIEVDDEYEEFPSWEDCVIPENIKGYHIQDGIISVYNVSDALAIISILPDFKSH